MNLNNQKPERHIHRADGSLEVHHIFPTIQGEGPFAGMPAIFVRLTGCNLQCPFCDTEYTEHRILTLPELIVIRIYGATACAKWSNHRKLPIIVITGGEPFRQNLVPLVTYLSEIGYQIQIETNGTFEVPQIVFDKATIVCSPKIGLSPKLKAHIFKYVLQAGYIGEDGLPTFTLGNVKAPVARPPEGAEILIQPLDEQDAMKNAANLEACVQSSFKFGYRVGIQMHKLLNLG
jgi:7-carboxy-7-deazaguanine synthase